MPRCSQQSSFVGPKKKRIVWERVKALFVCQTSAQIKQVVENFDWPAFLGNKLGFREFELKIT